MNKPQTHTDAAFYRRQQRRAQEIVGNDKLQELSRKQRDQKLEIDRWAERILQQQR